MAFDKYQFLMAQWDDKDLSEQERQRGAGRCTESEVGFGVGHSVSSFSGGQKGKSAEGL